MDHGGGPGGHGGHEMPGGDMPKCSMNMLWNHQVEDTCVVFRTWHISNGMGMAISCLAIMAISIGYAFILARMRTYERSLVAELAGRPRPAATTTYNAVANEEAGKLGITKLAKNVRVVRAGMYAITVAISYFLMLVAMTYNTYLCAAIVIGAFVGHYLYEDEIDLGALASNGATRGLACH